MSSDSENKKAKDLLASGVKPIDSAQVSKAEESFATDADHPVIKEILDDLLKHDRASYIKNGLKELDVAPAFQERKSGGREYYHTDSVLGRDVIRRIRDGEEMIGIILGHRTRQVSAFARPRPNRFDIGFTLSQNLKAHKLDDENLSDFLDTKVIPRVRDIIVNCGDSEVDSELSDRNRMTFAQYLTAIVEDALSASSMATEIVYTEAGDFAYFKPVDALTVYFLKRTQDERRMEQIRETAENYLASVRDGTNVEDLNLDVTGEGESDETEKYDYAQVLDGQVKQVFTKDQLVYWNVYANADYRRLGYPISPYERLLASLSTHINLTTHNKLFFLNGRGAKNIMVLKSDNVNPKEVEAIRVQMTAHINSAQASHRMPVFALDKESDVQMVPLDSGGRDMEFSYLADLNKRMIFAAFQMSPDEVAALGYLSRGTNSQSLAESNTEWKMTAARDLGLRPLLNSIEDMVNNKLLPVIEPKYHKYLIFAFEGMSADTPEKEATRLQQDSQLYLTMDQLLARVEEESVPIGGKIPLNPQFLGILEKYFTKRQILASFEDPKYADREKFPDLDYYMGDPMWLQIKQMEMQEQQMAAQQQQMAAQQQQMGAQPPPQGEERQPLPPQDDQEPPRNPDLKESLGQLQDAIQKTETDEEIPLNRRILEKYHDDTRAKLMNDFGNIAEHRLSEILKLINTPKKK